MIGRCTPEDMDWIVAVARKNFPEFNEAGVRKIFPELMKQERVLLLRGDHGWVLSFIEDIPWHNHISLYVDLVALDKTRKSISEMAEILAYLKKIGEAAGATKMRFCSLDAVGNLGCFVKRLGGREIGKIWEV